MSKDQEIAGQHFRFSISDVLLLITMIAILLAYLNQLPINPWWLNSLCLISAIAGGVIGARWNHGWHALRGAVWGTLVGGAGFALLVYPSLLIVSVGTHP